MRICLWDCVTCYVVIALSVIHLSDILGLVSKRPFSSTKVCNICIFSVGCLVLV